MSVANPFDEMASRWPSTVVARNKIGEFTGGLISPGTMANFDCKGEGPEERVMIGRNSGYTVRSFVPWLKERSEMKAQKRAAR